MLKTITINYKSHKEKPLKSDIKNSEFKEIAESRRHKGNFNEYAIIPKEIYENYDKIFWVGGRGLGKSYHAREILKTYRDRGKKFLYIRNVQAELKNVDSWLLKSDKRIKKVVRGRPFAGAINIKYHDEFDLPDEHVGYAVDLGHSLDDKGLEDDSVELIIYEEFQHKDISLEHMKKCWENFKSIIETIGRERNLKILFISNNIRGATPLFKKFANDPKAVHLKLFKNYYEGVLEYLDDEELAHMKGYSEHEKIQDEGAYVEIIKINVQNTPLWIYKHIGNNEYYLLDRQLDNPAEYNGMRDFEVLYNTDRIEFQFENDRVSNIYVYHIMELLEKVRKQREEIISKTFRKIRQWGY